MRASLGLSQAGPITQFGHSGISEKLGLTSDFLGERKITTTTWF